MKYAIDLRCVAGLALEEYFAFVEKNENKNIARDVQATDGLFPRAVVRNMQQRENRAKSCFQ